MDNMYNAKQFVIEETQKDIQQEYGEEKAKTIIEGSTLFEKEMDENYELEELE